MTDKPALTKTLLLTIALPDFYAEDFTTEAMEEFGYESMYDLVHEDAGLISDTARLFIMIGDMSGNDLHGMRAVIVSADIVDRAPEHDEPEDERLTQAIADGVWF